MSMNGPILTHATEAELATAVSTNLALFRAMQLLPGCEVVESDRWSMWSTITAVGSFLALKRSARPTGQVSAPGHDPLFQPARTTTAQPPS
jgi:hypothetical protein